MDEIDKIAQAIEEQVQSNSNYHGYDSESYDDEESALNMDNDILGMDTSKTIRALGLSSFSLRMVYTPVAGVPLPVAVELFGPNFNTGVIVGETFVFTNAGGDFVTVTGITQSWRAFMDRMRSAPFKIKYIRQSVQNAGQFSNIIRLQKDTIFGSGNFNSLDPDDFLTPEQFQLLRVDIPFNTSFDSERRAFITINPTEIGTGTKFAIFFSGVEAPINALAKKPTTIAMKGIGILSDQSVSTRDAINESIKAQRSTLGLIKQLAITVRSSMRK